MLDWLTEEARKAKVNIRALESLTTANSPRLEIDKQRALLVVKGELRAYRRCIARAKRTGGAS
ncbi:MAG: hypothetical protein Q7K03_04240 [Dehalococcoidia bacterium]|nr:hypothetical protein [Dehalococcoidia bacterium]